MNRLKRIFLLALCIFSFFPLLANATLATTENGSTLPPQINNSGSSISANIAAINIPVSAGLLQDWIEKKFNIKNDHGIRFSGAWLGDVNNLFSGGIHDAKRWTSNSLLLLGMTIDTQKLIGLAGGLFGVQFLQFNGQSTNTQAGSIQGYNSLPGANPLNRSELYQLWYRQKLFDNKLIIRL